MDLGLNAFDFFGLFVLGLSGVMAFARGLIREMFSVIAFIGGAIAGIYLSEPLRPFVESFTPLSGVLAAIAAGVFVFLVVFIVITIAVALMAKQVHESTEIGSFDRAAGLAFGILRGVLVVALLVLLVRRTDEGSASPDPFRDGIREARTFPIYNGVAAGLEVVLPRAGQRARDMINGQKGESAPIPPAEPDAKAQNP